MSKESVKMEKDRANRYYVAKQIALKILREPDLQVAITDPYLALQVREILSELREDSRD